MKQTAKQVKVVKEKDQTNLLKIGELSKLSGIGIEALRFYEKCGLLDRPVRTYSGYRMYDKAALERLAFIKKAQVLGFSLEQIKQVILDSETGEQPCLEVREMVRQKLVELDFKLKQLQEYRDELATTLENWDKVGQAEGHVCGLIEGTSLDKLNTSHKHSHQLLTKIPS